MSDGPERNDGEPFDVVLLHGPTDDGEGARVLRARPGRLDAGEVRPMREGLPISPGGEVVRLQPRPGAPAVYDVAVEWKVPATEGTPTGATTSRQAPAAAALPAELGARGQSGPAQVATRAYRDNWELTFGARRKQLN